MELFLDKRELVSFALTEDISIEPERFVETKTHYSDWGTSFKRTVVQVLPDGTKHGQHFSTSLGNGKRKDEDLDYKMGKLHGKYIVEIFDETSCEKQKGKFRDGIPIGTFSFERCQWNETPKTYFLAFVDGLPVQFWGEDSGEISLVWGKEGTVSIGGVEYTNVQFSRLEDAPSYAGCPFLDDKRVNITHELQKFSPEVYALDSQKRLVKLFIPVFPN
nr:hypothetical protein [Marseillevirus cajuinensis]